MVLLEMIQMIHINNVTHVAPSAVSYR